MLMHQFVQSKCSSAACTLLLVTGVLLLGGCGTAGNSNFDTEADRLDRPVAEQTTPESSSLPTDSDLKLGTPTDPVAEEREAPPSAGPADNSPEAVATAAAERPPAVEPVEADPEEPPAPQPLPPEVAGLQPLDPSSKVWLDVRNKRVITVGEICRQEGPLEMFACLKNSKEHESIVAIDTKAFVVNAALIALGANPGGPVQFLPEYKPASGPEVEVTVTWTNAEGKRETVRAQEWIRNQITGKAMVHPWVFGGSGFWLDESTGKRHFMAEDGDLVCVSNFTSAMLDLPVKSSQASSELQFEAFTGRIPPKGTQVVMILKPKLKPDKPEPAPEEPPPEDEGEKS